MLLIIKRINTSPLFFFLQEISSRTHDLEVGIVKPVGLLEGVNFAVGQTKLGTCLFDDGRDPTIVRLKNA